jgi:hypothetical protein
MAFDTTFDISINGVTKTLNRIRYDGYSSEYLLRTTTEEYRIFVRNSEVKSKKVDPLFRGVDRHNVEFVHRIFATSSSAEIVRRAYCVHENYQGDDLTAVKNDVVGAITKMASAGMIDDMLRWMA